MIVSINQPAYLPWLGYFQRIAASDLHIVLDHVQLEKNSFTNRNRVRTCNGWSWLTVPVRTKGRFGELAINEVEVDNGVDWRRKHWETIRQNYGKAPYFSDHEGFLRELFSREWTRLIELCDAVTSYLLSSLSIDTLILHSSKLEPVGTKDVLVLDLCRKAGATKYLSGALGRDYLREGLFAAEGIEVSYQDYAHPTYPQMSAPFEPYMSALDLLLNCGPASRDILMEQKEKVAR